jgi:molecular chaperone IbpA
VPGYSASQIEIMAHGNVLTVFSGKKEADPSRYLHKGIAAEPFERTFYAGRLCTSTQANMADGLLMLELEREIPEAMQPRKININASGTE